MDDRLLARVELSGGPARVSFVDDGGASPHRGVMGIDVAPRTIDDTRYTVVQLLLDDDVAGFDHSLLDGPLVADLVDRTGHVLVREPFDHDQFRRELLRERAAGESVRRGVLVLTEGEPPPPWIRLAFLPAAIEATVDTSVEVRRTSVAELRAGVEAAFAEGLVNEDERRTLLLTIEHRHPDAPEAPELG